MTFPSPSFNTSSIVIPFKGALPVFSTVILNLTVSPTSISPSPPSTTVNVLVTSILVCGVMTVIVGSSTVFPSESSPSSEVSETLPV